ncbi:MAG: hypothetical protein ACR2OG_17260 [Gemmatimonadaceae bacterium]
MIHHSKFSLPLGCALAALACTTPISLAAQRTAQPVAEYRLADGTIRITLGGPRVEVFLWQGDKALMVYLLGSAVDSWADSANALLSAANRAAPGALLEYETPVLHHPDTSYASGLMLARQFRGRQSQCFLTAWVGRGLAAMFPLTDDQARRLVESLRLAAAESRDSIP